MPDIVLNFQGSTAEYPALHYANSQTLQATVAVGTGAGTSATATITGSSANWVRFAINTGNAPVLNGDLATITMPVAFPVTLCPVVCSQSTPTTADWGKFKFVSISTTQWKVVIIGTATAGITYDFAAYIGG